MSNKILNIVSVLEDKQLACAEDRNVLCFDCSENTINILKQYLERTYQHDFGKQPYLRLFVSTIYNISNHIRETFYFHPSNTSFNSIEIQGDFFIIST